MNNAVPLQHIANGDRHFGIVGIFPRRRRRLLVLQTPIAHPDAKDLLSKGIAHGDAEECFVRALFAAERCGVECHEYTTCYFELAYRSSFASLSSSSS